MLVVKPSEWTDHFGAKHPPELIPATRFKANLREDTGEVLGIVSDEYGVVDNRKAFRFLDALIGSELPQIADQVVNFPCPRRATTIEARYRIARCHPE
jgi:hypothetical protein